jgi:VanZ family protein
LNTLGWLPRGVAQWADAHPQFDNFPAFGLVSLLFFAVTSTAAQFLIVLGALCLFNIGLEVAQLFMPQRHCDVWDIFWGCAGALTAGLVVAGLKCLCKPCLAAPCITKLK